MNAPSAVIVGSAPTPEGATHYARLIASADLVVAADGGLLVCVAAGRVPDAVVGDFDSVPAEAVARARALGAEVFAYPTDKDASDLDLALAVARSWGARPVTLTAAFSGRLDHTLAALGTLVRAADLDGVADEPGWSAHALAAVERASVEFDEPPGTVISVMAVGGPAVVSSDGLVFPLRETVLEPLSSVGLSNVASCRPQRVRVLRGDAVVIVNRVPDGVHL